MDLMTLWTQDSVSVNFARKGNDMVISSKFSYLKKKEGHVWFTIVPLKPCSNQ